MTRVGLVGCVKEKLARRSRARDLYVSTLFRGRRRAVEKTCDRWFILSALHGLVDPDQHLKPYDLSLTHLGTAERRRWASAVVRDLESKLGSLAGIHFELHAGSAYLEHGLMDALRARGATTSWPTEGMPMGVQLQYYAS